MTEGRVDAAVALPEGTEVTIRSARPHHRRPQPLRALYDAAGLLDVQMIAAVARRS